MIYRLLVRKTQKFKEAKKEGNFWAVFLLIAINQTYVSLRRWPCPLCIIPTCSVPFFVETITFFDKKERMAGTGMLGKRRQCVGHCTKKHGA